MRIVYFGQEGSFAHETALKAFPKARAYLPGINSRGVLEFLYQRKADCGIVPIENSSEGTVTESVDALISPEFAQSRARIQEELILPVRLHILSNARSLRSVERIYSYPVPMNHLDGWLKKNLPRVKRIPTLSTSEGAMMAAEDPKAGAAIGNAAAAKIYGLKILRRLAPRPNQTRFYAIARKAFSEKPAQRTAVCFGLPNKSGSLVTLLSIFAAEGINLTRIISRPLDKREKGFRPNEYVFWVDFDGNPLSSHIRGVLKKARAATTFLDVTGSYRSRLLK